MEKYSMIHRAGESAGERISYQSLPFGKSRIKVLTFDGTQSHRETKQTGQTFPRITRGVQK
jgi:hypothetical protein